MMIQGQEYFGRVQGTVLLCEHRGKIVELDRPLSGACSKRVSRQHGTQ